MKLRFKRSERWCALSRYQRQRVRAVHGRELASAFDRLAVDEPTVLDLFLAAHLALEPIPFVSVINSTYDAPDGPIMQRRPSDGHKRNRSDNELSSDSERETASGGRRCSRHHVEPGQS